MAVGETDDYTCVLVRHLRANSLETTAVLPEVRARYEQFRDLRDRDGFLLTDDGILLFSVDGSDGIVSRYAPFTVAPDAKYSLGVIKTGERAKITAMRNPWIEFPSVPLGEVFRRFGGGGHHRVASTRLHDRTLQLRRRLRLSDPGIHADSGSDECMVVSVGLETGPPDCSRRCGARHGVDSPEECARPEVNARVVRYPRGHGSERRRGTQSSRWASVRVLRSRRLEPRLAANGKVHRVGDEAQMVRAFVQLYR